MSSRFARKVMAVLSMKIRGNLFRAAVDREATYANINSRYTAIQKLPEPWDKYVKNKTDCL